jgi:phosphoglycolate phosphatase
VAKEFVIFDLDGTLCDSSLVIAGAVNHVREALGLEPMDSETIIKNINNTSINPSKFFYNSDTISPVHSNLFLEFYHANQDRLMRLYDGVEELLRELKTRGYLLAVATNAYRAVTLKSLKSLGVYELFDEVISADDVKEPKPSPEMLLTLLKKRDIPKEKALFIGDGERDMLSAKRAGIDFILINWGFNSYQDAVSSIGELRERIFSL